MLTQKKPGKNLKQSIRTYTINHRKRMQTCQVPGQWCHHPRVAPKRMPRQGRNSLRRPRMPYRSRSFPKFPNLLRRLLHGGHRVHGRGEHRRTQVKLSQALPLKRMRSKRLPQSNISLSNRETLRRLLALSQAPRFQRQCSGHLDRLSNRATLRRFLALSQAPRFH